MKFCNMAVVVPVDQLTGSKAALSAQVWGRASNLLMPALGKLYRQFHPANDAWGHKLTSPFGVVLGCFLANLLGSTIVDVIFGTLATLLACLVTYKLRNIRFKGLALAASLPPVVFNAVIIGIEIAVMFPDPSSSAPLWLACVTNGISVGIGELISCTVLGVLLVRIIEASPAVRTVFES